MIQILSEFTLAASISNTGCAFTPTVIAEEDRVDSDAGIGTVTFDLPIVPDSDFWDAMTDPSRRTRGRITLIGADLFRTKISAVSVKESMTVGDYRTADFQAIGKIFGMPTIDVPRSPFAPCDTAPVPTTGRTPLSYGNKATEVFAGFAAGFALNEYQIFKGLTFQKSNDHNVQVIAKFTAVDDSLIYAHQPICFEVIPFSGMRRGDVVRALAAQLGIPSSKVICPLGPRFNKPLLLTNGSLLPFIADFGAGENWFPYFDREGNLVVKEIELKEDPEDPDWTLDASKGAFYYDTLQERLPSGPPTTYYVTATEPIPNNDGDESTFTTIEQLIALYAPQCVKVRPSGAPSYLYGDGSYRSIDEQRRMVVSRRETTITSRNGKPIRERVRTWQFYNPEAYDPNFNGIPPPSSNYDGAYGNQTFHGEEVEKLVLVLEEQTEYDVDVQGTVMGKSSKKTTWYSPQSALEYAINSTRSQIMNHEGYSYVYPGGVMRSEKVQLFRETEKIDTTYQFASDGVIEQTKVRTYHWLSPNSRCDIVIKNEIPIPDSPPIPNPPPPIPPPTPPGPPPPPIKSVWKPTITGPTRILEDVFWFDVDCSGAPSTLDAQIFVVNNALHGDTHAIPPFSGDLFGHQLTDYPFGGGGFGFFGIGPNGPRKFKKIFFINVPNIARPIGFQYAFFNLHVTVLNPVAERGTIESDEFRWDPWAGIPPGRNLAGNPV